MIKQHDAASSKECPTPTVPTPDMMDVEEWEEEGGCEATDGCWVEPNGVCIHGHPSWLLRLGLI
jgi:hypothetical protein